MFKKNNTITFQGLHDEALRAAKSANWLKAKEGFELALDKEPNSSEALYNLALVYDKLDEKQLALRLYDQALKIEPNFIAAHINRGVLLYERLEFEEAINSYDRAIAINPLTLDAWLNKGNSLHSLGRYDDALKTYKEALDIDPESHDVLWNKSLVDLTLGNLSKGWEGYESRFKAKKGITPLFQKIPRLDDLKKVRDKRILVWHEQGYGDSIQFCRFLNLISDIGAEVIFYVQSPLLRFLNENLSCCCTDKLKDIGRVDYQIPLLSIPRLFSVNPFTVSNQEPYLKISDSSVNYWRNTLNIKYGSKLNIGLAVSGSALHASNQLRSIQAQFFSNIDAKFYLIQKDIASNDKEWITQHANYINCSNLIGDFHDSASIAKAMDLIISVDTSLAHLSGALGIRTILLLSQVSEWRWLMDSQSTPWYKSVSLFRQNRLNDWGNVMLQVENYVKSIPINEV